MIRIIKRLSLHLDNALIALEITSILTVVVADFLEVIFFKKRAIYVIFSLFSSFHSVDSAQGYKCYFTKNLHLARLKLKTSGIGSDRSAD